MFRVLGFHAFSAFSIRCLDSSRLQVPCILLQAQRAQYPLNEESTLNYRGRNVMTYGRFLI